MLHTENTGCHTCTTDQVRNNLSTDNLQRAKESQAPMIQNLSSPKALALGHYELFQTCF